MTFWLAASPAGQKGGHHLRTQRRHVTQLRGQGLFAGAALRLPDDVHPSLPEKEHFVCNLSDEVDSEVVTHIEQVIGSKTRSDTEQTNEQPITKLH